MAIQVDPISSPRIITIPKADLDSNNSITVQNLVNQIREWEHELINLGYIKLLSATGKEDLGGNTKVGITATLENVKIKFEAQDSPIVCTIRGGNIVAVDSDGYAMSVIEPSSNVTAVLAQSTSPSLVAEWSENEKNTLLNTIEMIKQINSGKWVLENNQLIFYENDNGTELMRFNLFDQTGQPAMKNIFTRERA